MVACANIQCAYQRLQVGRCKDWMVLAISAQNPCCQGKVDIQQPDIFKGQLA